LEKEKKGDHKKKQRKGRRPGRKDELLKTKCDEKKKKKKWTRGKPEKGAGRARQANRMTNKNNIRRGGGGAKVGQRG